MPLHIDVRFGCVSRSFLALVAHHWCRAERVQVAPARIDIFSPDRLQGHFLGLFGTFSGSAGLNTRVLTWTPPGNTHGCAPYKVPRSPPDFMGIASIVDRGDCSFVNKSMQAQLAGATGVFVVSDSDQIVAMAEGSTVGDMRNETDIHIFSVSMQHMLGTAIRFWNANHSLELSVTLSVQPYILPQESFLDFSLVVEVLIATSLLVGGALFGTADLRPGSPLVPRRREEVLHIEAVHAPIYCFLGSGMLVVLFFLMKYLIYVVMAAFCFGGASCVQQISSAILQYNCPSLRRLVFTIGDEEISIADVIAVVPAASIVVGWVWFRNTEYGFIYQNTIGAGFLCMIQRQLRLPNLKVAAVLLTTMFFFDIFWVFLSPLFFGGKSVMVEVAKGGGTNEAVPMLIRVPTMSESRGGDRMLGFGDIALPGLLVSYLLRHDSLDKRTCRRGYFVPGVVGYVAGLLTTCYVLVRTHMGQPALLYLVPGTLLPVLSLSWCRGELRTLWEGLPKHDAHLRIEEAELPEVLGAPADGGSQPIIRARLSDDSLSPHSRTRERISI